MWSMASAKAGGRGAALGPVENSRAWVAALSAASGRSRLWSCLGTFSAHYAWRSASDSAGYFASRVSRIAARHIFLRQVSTGVVIAFGEVGDHSVVDGTRERTPHGEHGQQFRRNANYFPHGCFAVFARGRSEFETESFAEQVLECDVIAGADCLMVGENRPAVECFPRAILSLNLVRNQDLGVQEVYSRGLFVRTKTPPCCGASPHIAKPLVEDYIVKHNNLPWKLEGVTCSSCLLIE
ncbi:hypothetical protein CCANI_04860 [Corynebacterium canis]|nr:hypothetical protein CCANI_04860 [Corynebacterium canis]